MQKQNGEHTTKVGDTFVADGFVLNVPEREPLSVIYFFDEESRYPLGWEVASAPRPAHLCAAFRKSCMMIGRIPGTVLIDGGAFREVFFPNDGDFNEVLTIVGVAGCNVDLSHRSLPTMHFLSLQQCGSMEAILHTVERVFESRRNGRQYHNHLAGRTPRDVLKGGLRSVGKMPAMQIGILNWLWRNEDSDLAVASC